MNLLYITRSIDVLSGEVRREAYDRLRFYLPMVTRMAELSDGEVYIQSEYNVPNPVKKDAGLARMAARGRSVKKYQSGSKIDAIVCAIFCPSDDQVEFQEDVDKFIKTLEDTGAPYIYHDSDKEFTTEGGKDQFHDGEVRQYFLGYVESLPEDHILKTRLKGIATSVPDEAYFKVLREKFPGTKVTYYPAVFWSDWKTRYPYRPLAERGYEFSFLRSFYLDKHKSMFTKNWGNPAGRIKVLLGSRNGSHTGNTGLLKGSDLTFDVVKQGASYKDLCDYFSKTLLTPSSSLYERITSKLFEAAESRTLAILLESCFTSAEVTHPAEAQELIKDLPVVRRDGSGLKITEWAEKIRTLSDEEYSALLDKQDKLIDLCFSIDSDYITNLSKQLIEDFKK